MLHVDTRVDCHSGEYTVLFGCAMGMGAVWVFGIPCYWLYSLRKHSDSIHKVGEQGQPSMVAQQFAFLISAYKPEYYLWEVAEMWRKVTLTGVISVVSPGSIVQIITASAISLMFLTLHARCYPFKDDHANIFKLGAEVALMLVFLCTAVLRTLEVKRDLVDAKDLTREDEIMPTLLAVTMVVVTCGVPLMIASHKYCPQVFRSREPVVPQTTIQRLQRGVRLVQASNRLRRATQATNSTDEPLEIEMQELRARDDHTHAGAPTLQSQPDALARSKSAATPPALTGSKSKLLPGIVNTAGAPVLFAIFWV